MISRDISVDKEKSLRRTLLGALVVCALCIAAVVTGCMENQIEPYEAKISLDAESFDADPFITDWFETIAQCAKRSPEFADPVAARAYAYISIAMYESLRSGYSDKSPSLSSVLFDCSSFPQVDSTKRYHWLVVANSAIAGVAKHMFRYAPTDVQNDLAARENYVYDGFQQRFSDDNALRRSVEFGKTLAQSINAYADADGIGQYEQNPYATDFVPTSDPSCWHPNNSDGKSLLSQWGSLRPFLIRRSEIKEQLNPGPFPTFSTKQGSVFFKAAVDTYTRYTSLRPEDRAAIEFWGDEATSDRAFSTHMITVVARLMRGQSYSVRFASDVFVRLALGMADASIATYSVKYTYPLIRPSTYLSQHANPSVKPDGVIDNIVVPPCPEFCSTFMAMSESACSVLSGFFPADVKITDRWKSVGAQSERGYAGFSNMLAEIRATQFGNGSHYGFSVEAGSKIGTSVSAISSQRFPVRR